MALVPRSPVLTGTIGPMDKVDAAEALDVTIDSKPCSYLRVRANKLPDTGLYHTLFINGSTTNGIRMRSGPGDASEFVLDLRHVMVEDKMSAYRIFSVAMTAGADATTFEVIANL